MTTPRHVIGAVGRDERGIAIVPPVPVAPQLLEAIVAMKPGDTSPECFLTTKWNRPFSNAASFGTWFKKQCVAAGLPHCTMHGLRKATLRRMADLRMTNKDMKSVSGQRSDKTLAGYIEKADQARLAEAAMADLSAWETAVRKDDNTVCAANRDDA